MFGKHKQAKTAPGSGGGMMDAGAPLPQAEEVRSLLARGKTKPAVELAKQIHKRSDTPASEALLVDAYAARIQSLLKQGLTTEAEALLGLVRERYPSAKGKLADIGVVVAASQGSLDDLVRPLNDPAVPEERRATIENAIKRQVDDLSALAQCAALAPEHPLRAGALALEKALVAVTSGPVVEAAFLLPEVSRRGPLAPWKLLVRAIACFYRQDDAACERYLQAIDPDSAPARLVPAMRAMLTPESDKRLQPASASLVAEVGGSMEALRGALESLDAALAAKAQNNIIVGIQRAIPACRAACPELVERLRQHISIAGTKLKLPTRRVQAAMGGPSLKNAYFWRLFAHSVENAAETFPPLACSLWEQFRRHALAEGWFREDGPEAAALYLHMAELLRYMPSELLNEIFATFETKSKGFGDYYEDQPPAIRAVEAKYRTTDSYFLSPAKLFERACAIDPHREAFEQWLAWAKEECDGKAADRVAESWRRALPNDSRPLLYLMESAEKRGALKKATGFLEQAETVDALNPEVRRAALRLLVAQAIRHLRQRKAHLAEPDLEALEALPQAQEADRPAFLAGLRWTCCLIRDDTDAALRHFSQASRLLESPAAAILTCGSTGEVCGFRREEFAPYLPAKVQQSATDSLAAAVARACALGDDMGVAFSIPAGWERDLFKELSDKHSRLEARQLRALGEAALRRGRRELAYAASAAGLAKGGDAEARFLLLRARALPEWEFERCEDCLAAAAELGRRRRDMALVDEAVELRRGRGGRRMDFMDWVTAADERTFSMTTEQINAVLKREKQSRAFPAYQPPPYRDRFQDHGYFDGDEDDEDDEDDQGPTLEEITEHLRELRKAEQKREQAKKGRREFPGQGELF
jgi:hypothetical protein